MNLIKYSFLDEPLPETIKLFGRIFILNKKNIPAFGCYYSQYSRVTIQVFGNKIEVKLYLDIMDFSICNIAYDSSRDIQSIISDHETYILDRINIKKEKCIKSYNDINDEFGKLLILL